MTKDSLSLGEGNTPLIKAIRLNLYFLENFNVYFKNELLNPNGNIEDRGVYNYLKDYIDKGKEGVIVYSTGEAAASVASYASRMGLKSFIFVAKEQYKEKRYKKALKFDTKIFVIDEEEKEIIKNIYKLTENYPYLSIIPLENKIFMDGIKTIIKEIEDKIKKIDYIIVKKAEVNSGRFRFYKEIFSSEDIKVLGVSTEESGSDIITVDEYDVIEALNTNRKQEGIVEEEAAILTAGVMKCAEENVFKSGDNIVCLVDERENIEELEEYEKQNIYMLKNGIEEIKFKMGLKNIL
ncbi:PLP-dependent lyase/thiolase [Haliovirga abyssi]|uniref:Tryptophan synthase beta chain-like PALP domain-containing protein n=1 Tax=Haliovirga abyssi TaxID=2996794 RepID=A0AAU9D1F6_9FUSO|nr:PLP-dependent lyase/thiolase [Haliovirga abyssi]BDU49804.1 hypothetical protein HLVA_03730 [Haliovirga abyssi]